MTQGKTFASQSCSAQHAEAQLPAKRQDELAQPVRKPCTTFLQRNFATPLTNIKVLQSLSACSTHSDTCDRGVAATSYNTICLRGEIKPRPDAQGAILQMTNPCLPVVILAPWNPNVCPHPLHLILVIGVSLDLDICGEGINWEAALNHLVIGKVGQAAILQIDNQTPLAPVMCFHCKLLHSSTSRRATVWTKRWNMTPSS